MTITNLDDGTLIPLYTCFNRISSYAGKGHVYIERGNILRRSYAELFSDSARIHAHFCRIGLQPGERVLLLAADTSHFIAAFLGCVRGGLIPVPVCPPTFNSHDTAYAAQLGKITAVSKAALVVIPQSLLPLVTSTFAQTQVISYEKLQDKLKNQSPVASSTLDDTCFLQFTSGSTGDPKGVIVTHRNVAANARAIMLHGIDIQDNDIGVSWLPLFHDMGLIGKVLSPLIYPTEMVFLPTFSFIKNPALWLETISRYQGSISFAPNFAFALATRFFKRRPRALNLKSLRVLGCGAEPINASVLHDFIETFAPYGLRPQAVTPCYGMAEATLAVTLDSRIQPFRTLIFDRHIYKSQQQVCLLETKTKTQTDSTETYAQQIVACGRPFPFHDIAIIDQQGAQLNEGQVGQIVVRGPSIAAGYFDNTTASAETFVDGWLHTGDLGFMFDGELFISGRNKDLIIVNGHNFYPQDIEWNIERLAGVRTGAVAVFAVGGYETEKVVVVAEVKKRAASPNLCNDIKILLSRENGIAVHQIILVQPGSIPKSTSGKVQRSKVRSSYIAGHFDHLSYDRELAEVL